MEDQLEKKRGKKNVFYSAANKLLLKKMSHSSNFSHLTTSGQTKVTMK
jgi:hypothetical protein